MDLEMDELLFELRGPQGQVWKLYLDGRAEGFPADVAIYNYAAPLVDSLIGKVKRAVEGRASEQFQPRS